MGDASREKRPTSPVAHFLFVSAVVAGAAAGLARGLSVPWAWAALVGVNAATLALYGYDKAVAGGRRTRVPESVLHLLAFVGGTPAAFAGQQLFRHKTVKDSFRRMFWLITILQLALVGFVVWCWYAPPAWLPGFLRRLFPTR